MTEFNNLANTELTFEEFQGVYGGAGHQAFVRNILTEQQVTANSDLGREDLVKMFQVIIDEPENDSKLTKMFGTIEKTWPGSNPSDLVFWPGEYFGDGDDSRELTADEMADEILKSMGKSA